MPDAEHPEAAGPIPIRLRVNGRERSVEVLPGETLLDVLRRRLHLTGTKRGCEIGECGACTVVLDGRAVNACLVLAVQADGANVLTVEGLAQVGHADGAVGGAGGRVGQSDQSDQNLHPLQRAFLDHGAVQCGFCTPGVLMSAVALLARDPSPTPEAVRRAIAGNLCRCTGYQAIVDAILAAAAARKPG